jgi:hypothetical protein
MGKVRDIDRGWKRYVREMGRINGSFVKVGLPDGGKPGRAKGQRPDSPRPYPKILVIGAVHEFGSVKANVPERSYLRASFDKNKAKMSRRIESVYGAILSRRMDVREGLVAVGTTARDQAKLFLQRLRTPPLKVSPRKKYGGSNPLNDTDQLVNSLQYEVTVR